MHTRHGLEKIPLKNALIVLWFTMLTSSIGNGLRTSMNKLTFRHTLCLLSAGKLQSSGVRHLCTDTDCYIPAPEDMEDLEDEDQKCTLCPGYFEEDDDYVELGRGVCELCHQIRSSVVKMKRSEEIMCQNGCNESSEDSEED